MKRRTVDDLFLLLTNIIREVTKIRTLCGEYKSLGKQRTDICNELSFNSQLEASDSLFRSYREGIEHT